MVEHVWKFHCGCAQSCMLVCFRADTKSFESQVHDFYCHSHYFASSPCRAFRKLACHFVFLVPRSTVIWGHVVFATQETSPYDIAVVSLEEDLDGVPVPVPAEHFHEGKGQRGSLVWGEPQEGKSVLGALTLQIRGQSHRSAPFPTPAGVMSQAGTLLRPGYRALAGVALGGLPAHAQHA